MPIRTCSKLAVLVAAVLAIPAAALAQTRPGVGYDPQARGLSTTHYQLDSFSSPFLSYQADFSAHPDLVGAHPDPYGLNYADPAVRAAIELRWGPGTASDRFRKWDGPSNEVRFVLRDALIWAFAKHPEILGGDVSNRNGQPTEVELTDAQAFNDRSLWVAYFQSELPGFSPEHRVVICDSTKPAGDVDPIDPFWQLPYYYHNKFQSLAVSPQLPASMACAGN
jgi:hypothetical protein